MGTRGHQLGHSGPWIAAGHQALADENGVRARARVCQQVSGAADAGLGDPDDLGGQAGRDPREHIAVDLERLEVAGVHADHGGARLERTIGLLLGVHFHQRGHAQRFGAIDQRGQHVLLQRSDDQQDDVRAVRAGLVDLVRADDEVLPQDRDVHRRTDRVQIVQ